MMKQTISKSLRDDFELELRKEHSATRMHFDIADAMAAFDRIFEVAQPLNQETIVAKPVRELPRRCYQDLYIEAEKAIFKAMQEVEKMPADVRLTKAVMLLVEAKDWVADFVDGIQREVK